MISKKSLIEQGSITKEKILSYLAEYKYSTPRTISNALNIKYPTVVAALNRYIKQELINEHKIPAPREKVVGISWLGLCELGITERSKVFHPSRFNERTLFHWLQCQNYATLKRNKGIECIPAPNDKIGVRGKGRVDLIETVKISDTQNVNIGIEVERTPKTPNRYMEIWGGHIEAIQKNQLAGIKYILTSKQSEVVKKIFDKTHEFVTPDKRKLNFEPYKNRFKFIINHDL
ncbi:MULTISPECIES: helix-turn-helix domain-containing protein [unclassified Francisella]|uniref:helix-turn-helix domain-containing protein n=1 Tax=unclassified Francisella TaxID=2610885 RepID=UPI002E341AE0|nr:MULTISPECIES: helix-turn-helix domain-containing protein [unclassified Francisella]MED7818416.1 helix-turn-helix domain-containing protein [Francisella sp. 19S2-4]MED7829329.1 helix-turn-helix domain-containing protein [Francisella sp. 19S2-10]